MSNEVKTAGKEDRDKLMLPGYVFSQPKFRYPVCSHDSQEQAADHKKVNMLCMYI